MRIILSMAFLVLSLSAYNFENKQRVDEVISSIQPLVNNVSLNGNDLEVTKVNGTSISIDLSSLGGIDTISLDNPNKRLVLSKSDGTTSNLDIKGLYDNVNISSGSLNKANKAIVLNLNDGTTLQIDMTSIYNDIANAKAKTVDSLTFDSGDVKLTLSDGEIKSASIDGLLSVDDKAKLSKLSVTVDGLVVAKNKATIMGGTDNTVKVLENSIQLTSATQSVMFNLKDDGTAWGIVMRDSDGARIDESIFTYNDIEKKLLFAGKEISTQKLEIFSYDIADENDLFVTYFEIAGTTISDVNFTTDRMQGYIVDDNSKRMLNANFMFEFDNLGGTLPSDGDFNIRLDLASIVNTNFPNDANISLVGLGVGNAVASCTTASDSDFLYLLWLLLGMLMDLDYFLETPQIS